MENGGNIVICGSSALHLHLHTDGLRSIGAVRVGVDDNPLDRCASNAEELSAFNTEHALYGGEPVAVLVTQLSSRRVTSQVKTHYCRYPIPDGSFFKLRDGLYVTSPELTFVQLGYGRSRAQLARIATNLCSRYFLHADTGEIVDRSHFITTPSRLRAYSDSVPGMRGAAVARSSLRWTLANSGSPAETQMMLLYTMPRRFGGFGLPLDVMNYDVPAGRCARLAEQGLYCIDLVNLDKHVGLEYDGVDSHRDSGADKRRRNALSALGWDIFAIDKGVLHDVTASEKAARQIARKLCVRIQMPKDWSKRHRELRGDLGLPAR